VKAESLTPPDLHVRRASQSAVYLLATRVIGLLIGLLIDLLARRVLRAGSIAALAVALAIRTPADSDGRRPAILSPRSGQQKGAGTAGSA
jgi:hypothetical protein